MLLKTSNTHATSVAKRRAGRATALALTAILLAGCATNPMTTGSIKTNKPIEQMNAVELRGALDTYQAAYSRKPDDKTIAMAYASVLRMNGHDDQALAVMRKSAIKHSTDRDVLAAYGKALAGAGEFTGALDAIQRAQDPTRPDWKLLSAEGAIYDQTGRPRQARERYQDALQIAPGEPSVLSNLAMSHMLANELPQAENYLRQAVQHPAADSRVRQNLSLVVGLQGRFDEARQIAQRELSPQQAAANMEYLQGMLSQQNAWSMIKKEDRSAN